MKIRFHWTAENDFVLVLHGLCMYICIIRAAHIRVQNNVPLPDSKARALCSQSYCRADSTNFVSKIYSEYIIVLIRMRTNYRKTRRPGDTLSLIVYFIEHCRKVSQKTT